MKAPVRTNKTAGKVFSAVHRGLYKLTKGRLGANFSGASVVILTTTGAKSGAPRVVQDGATSHDVSASELDGEARSTAWAKLTRANPDFLNYEKATERTIPVMLQTKS